MQHGIFQVKLNILSMLKIYIKNVITLQFMFRHLTVQREWLIKKHSIWCRTELLLSTVQEMYLLMKLLSVRHLSLEELRLMFQISLTQQQLRWKEQLFFLILELQQQKLKITVLLWRLMSLETLLRMVISLIQLIILTVIAAYAQQREELLYAIRTYQQLSVR